MMICRWTLDYVAMYTYFSVFRNTAILWWFLQLFSHTMQYEKRWMGLCMFTFSSISCILLFAYFLVCYPNFVQLIFFCPPSNVAHRSHYHSKSTRWRVNKMETHSETWRQNKVTSSLTQWISPGRTVGLKCGTICPGQYSCTVVIWKSANGQSTLQVRQRGGWEVFQMLQC